ncbi:MAG: peptidylprolyl isomerase [Phycisphaerales bacterium]|nr:peptidylprolyl isomerase [Phycisphaerales bacterium]
MLHLPSSILILCLPAIGMMAQPADNTTDRPESIPEETLNEPIGDEAKWFLVAQAAQDLRIRMRDEAMAPQETVLAMEILRDEVELYLSEQPYDYRAWNLIASLCGEMKDSNCVDKAANALLDLQPDNVQAGLQWAAYYAQVEQYDDALRILNSLLVRQPENLMYNNAWLITMDQEDPEGITKRFTELLKNPDDLRLAKAMTKARRQSNPWMAETMAKQLLEIAPEDPEAIEIMGRSYRACNHFKEAREILSTLPPETLKEPHIAYLYSDCFYADHQFEKAYAIMSEIDLEEADSRPGLKRRLNVMLPLRETAISSHAREVEIRARESESNSNPMVRLIIDGNPVIVELFQNQAPNTTGAFLALSRRGDYDDIPFGQVQTGFRSIGGTISGGVPYSLPSECGSDDDRHFFSGTLAVYLPFAGRPDSARGEWCIYHFPAPHLNGERTVFGRVTEGLEHVRAMKEDSRLDRVEIIRATETELDPVVIDEEGQRRPFSEVMSANSNTTAVP